MIGVLNVERPQYNNAFITKHISKKYIFTAAYEYKADFYFYNHSNTIT